MMSKFKNIVNKLFSEDHNPLEAIGISVNDIIKRINKVNPGDKRAIEDIKDDIDYALEFSEVISSEEKADLERLKLQLEELFLSKEIHSKRDNQVRTIK